MKRWAWACLAASITSSRRGLRAAVADVVEDRVVEQQRFLRDQADLAAQVAQPHVAEAARRPGGSRRRVGSAKRGIRLASVDLAAAVGADDGDRLAEWDPQVDVVQHRLAGLVGEIDTPSNDQVAMVPRAAARARSGCGRVGSRSSRS